MKNIGLLVLFAVLTISCNNSKNKEYSALEKQMETINHSGKKLIETNCYTCHSPTGTHDDRIGPPMIAIKKHQLKNIISLMKLQRKNLLLQYKLG